MEEFGILEQLAAREEIKQLKARRDRAVDSKDWALLRSLHADDHVSHNDGMDRWEGADAMIEAISGSLGPDKTTVHQSHTPDITFESPTRARGVWAMEDLIFDSASGELIIHGYGFYHEVYEKRGGTWLFTDRRLTRIHVREYPERRDD